MIVQPRMLSILTTRRCTAACDHCCIGSSPRERQAIPVERIHRLIDEARRIPSIELIGFTGGECFLLGDDLDALVAHAAEAGFKVRVMTNGYWAVNPRTAVARMSGLRNCGLDEMVLSTGSFHERFIPVERVVTAARAAIAVQVGTRIAIEDCDQSTFDDALLRTELLDLVAARNLSVVRHPWIADAGGRGRTQLTHERLIGESPDSALSRCSQFLDVISVTPDQDVKACCGFPLEQLPRMRRRSPWRSCASPRPSGRGRLANLVGDDGEAAPVLVRPRRLDRGVERERFRLVRDLVDDADRIRGLVLRRVRESFTGL